MLQPEQVKAVAEEDLLRARFYALLAKLLADPPDRPILDTLSGVEGDGTPLGRALAELAEAARQSSADRAKAEYNRLFIGLTEGELRPYGSFYLSGFLYEKPLADLRWDLQQLGIARSADVTEPEDHIAILCEVMHGLITGEFGEPGDLGAQKGFFNTHLAPWAFRFFEDLEHVEDARLYCSIGTVGRIFITIETESLSMVEGVA